MMNQMNDDDDGGGANDCDDDGNVCICVFKLNAKHIEFYVDM